ncbi:MAG: 2-dehydropantoate 2-reductase [Desulfurococcaceae archaeon]
MRTDICIVGGGAIGSIMALYAYRGGLDNIVVLYRSRSSVENVNSAGGLTVTYRGRDFFIPIHAMVSHEAYVKCDYLINSVKAIDVPDTIGVMSRLTEPGTPVLMVQNGFGSLELVESYLKDREVSCGVVFIGATRISACRVIHNGGETVFAGVRHTYPRGLFDLAFYMLRGGCDFRIVSDIDLYRWIKLALNAVVNPITAIVRGKNRVVLSKWGLELARIIIDEVVQAASKHGYTLDPDKLFKMVVRNVEAVAENYSSMYQDVINGRRTEIDFINGYVARELGFRGVNHILTLLVKLIEETYVDRFG